MAKPTKPIPPIDAAKFAALTGALLHTSPDWFTATGVSGSLLDELSHRWILNGGGNIGVFASKEIPPTYYFSPEVELFAPDLLTQAGASPCPKPDWKNLIPVVADRYRDGEGC